MIKLGGRVKDRISGFKGIVTARAEYLSGCIRYCVEPKITKDGKMADEVWFDENRLDVTSEVKKGGPALIPPGW